jgi:uncharacterized protein (TIGR02265 family)
VPHDAKDLSQRIALSTPQDTVKGSIFRSVVVELERRLPDDPRIPELRSRYVKSAWRDFSNFPVAEYLTLVYQAAELLEPLTGGFEEALTALGHGVSLAFLDSAVGKLALTMTSGRDPLAMLSYAASVYAVSASYGRRTYLRRGPHEAVLQLRRDFMPPAYHRGAVRAGVSFHGHPADVEVESFSLLDMDVLVRYPPAAAR